MFETWSFTHNFTAPFSSNVNLAHDAGCLVVGDSVVSDCLVVGGSVVSDCLVVGGSVVSDCHVSDCLFGQAHGGGTKVQSWEQFH